jgi:putative ABC transport system permease protein
MTLGQLARRSLRYYWRTNLAVVAGVAIAVAVLAGALVVGDSVRTSLRELAVGRLGRTDQLIASTGFFREALAQDLAKAPAFESGFAAAVGLIAIDGLVSHGTSGARASNVAVYGVDQRFWQFHGKPLAGDPLTGRAALASPALARELGASNGDGLLVRLRQPSAIPAATLHGRRDDLGKTIRVSMRSVLAPESLGEFSLRAQQGEVRALFLPLDRLQRELGHEGRVNALLVADRADATRSGASTDRSLIDLLASVKQLDDSGLRVRRVGGAAAMTTDPGTRRVSTPPAPGERDDLLAVESDSGLLSDGIIARATTVAGSLRLRTCPVFAYLARTIRIGSRSAAYSVVAGFDLDMACASVPLVVHRPGGDWRGDPSIADPIRLNAWTAEALGAHVGDRVKIDFEVWEDGGGIASRSAEFTLAGVLPMSGTGADRTLTPDYPGISDQTSVADWDPPFPIDLSRITPRDEDYWRQYRAAPKALIPYEVAERLWASRFGRMTSLRLATPVGVTAPAAIDGFARALNDALTVGEAGFVVQPVRARAIEAASGTTDFGQYFFYFSFFIVVSGLLLTGLFFRVGVEQRLREIGLLEAIGLTPAKVRGLFLREGLGLALAGSLLGLVGALGYAALIMLGLRTWWVDAVGTTALVLRPSFTALAAGLVGGLVTALGVVWWTLGQVSRAPARSLLKGAVEIELRHPVRYRVSTPGTGPGVSSPVPAFSARRRAGVRAALMGALTLLLLLCAAAGWIDPASGFFGAAASALGAGLFALAWQLRGPARSPRPASRVAGLTHAGVASATVRPGRSVLSVALIAFAAFVIVSVGAFRREDTGVATDPASGSGGYTLIGESVAPLMYDPATPQGRASYGLDSPEIAPLLNGVSVDRFRLRPGDDGSCLNLYRPENPRILAPTPQFVSRGGRFTFAATLAQDDAERANPWLLLNRDPGNGSIPAIVDATSLTYVFHKSLGDEIAVERTGGPPMRLRVVATLSHSIFQSDVIIADQQFVRLFPQNEGTRVWLVGAPPARMAEIARLLEERLSDFGLEVSETAERLRTYQRVENTYLSTFQALGALGLVLGTFGLGAVLLRNILERQREIALLQAVGYSRGHVRWMILSETTLLVLLGLALGVACALVAVQPALMRQGGGVSVTLIGGVLVAVILAGLAASFVAASVALRLPLLASLKTE